MVLIEHGSGKTQKNYRRRIQWPRLRIRLRRRKPRVLREQESRKGEKKQKSGSKNTTHSHLNSGRASSTRDLEKELELNVKEQRSQNTGPWIVTVKLESKLVTKVYKNVPGYDTPVSVREQKRGMVIQDIENPDWHYVKVSSTGRKRNTGYSDEAGEGSIHIYLEVEVLHHRSNKGDRYQKVFLPNRPCYLGLDESDGDHMDRLLGKIILTDYDIIADPFAQLTLNFDNP